MLGYSHSRKFDIFGLFVGKAIYNVVMKKFLRREISVSHLKECSVKEVEIIFDKDALNECNVFGRLKVGCTKKGFPRGLVVVGKRWRRDILKPLVRNLLNSPHGGFKMVGQRSNNGTWQVDIEKIVSSRSIFDFAKDMAILRGNAGCIRGNV